MPYNFAADSFHTKKLCSRLSSSEVRFRGKTVVLRFRALLWGLVRGKVRWSSLAHWKARIMDFSRLVLIELFSLLLRLRRYEWLSVQNRLFRSNVAGWPKISGRRGRPPPTILFSQKTRLNDLLYGIKIWTDFSSVLSLSRVWQMDKRADRIPMARRRLHSMQRCKKHWSAQQPAS